MSDIEEAGGESAGGEEREWSQHGVIPNLREGSLQRVLSSKRACSAKSFKSSRRADEDHAKCKHEFEAILEKPGPPFRKEAATGTWNLENPLYIENGLKTSWKPKFVTWKVCRSCNFRITQGFAASMEGVTRFECTSCRERGVEYSLCAYCHHVYMRDRFSFEAQRNSGTFLNGWGTTVVAGSIQFFDYASDLAVLLQWLNEGSRGDSFRLGLGLTGAFFLLLSMVISLITMLMNLQNELWRGEVKAFVAMLLVPFNLHIVYIGAFLDPSSDCIQHLWVNPDLKAILFSAKSFETASESLPLAALMVQDLVHEAWSGTGGVFSGVTVASLCLSVLSMAYGFSGLACVCGPGFNRRGLWSASGSLQVFCLSALDAVWLLWSYSIFCVESLGAWRFAVPSLCILVQVAVGVEELLRNAPPWYATRKNALYTFIVCVLGTFFDVRIFYSEVTTVPRTDLHPVSRRLCLLLMSALVIAAVDPRSAPLWSLLAAMAALHTYLSLRFFYMVGELDESFSLGGVFGKCAGCFTRRRRVAATGSLASQYPATGSAALDKNASEDSACPGHRAGAASQDLGSVASRNDLASAASTALDKHASDDSEALERVGSAGSAVERSSAEAAGGVEARALPRGESGSFGILKEKMRRTPFKVPGSLGEPFRSMPEWWWSFEEVRKFTDVSEAVLAKGCSVLDPACSGHVNDVVQDSLRTMGQFPVRPTAEEGEEACQEILERTRQYAEVLCHWQAGKKGEEKKAEEEKLTEGLQKVKAGVYRETFAPAEPYHGPPMSMRSAAVSEQQAHQGAQGEDVVLVASSDIKRAELRSLPSSEAANVWLWKSSVGSPQTYELTKEAEECSMFVSHSWSDGWYQKASQLRAFLLLQMLDAALCIMFALFACQLFPIGFLLQGYTGGNVWWIPSVSALCIGAAASLWSHATGTVLPARWGPWRWVKETVWLDKCCIDQTSDATKQAGIARLGDYLQRCQSVTVMLGPTYFERLWCTYELAHYCRKHEEHLEKRLSFLSLDWSFWRDPLSLVRRVRLSSKEEALLRGYSCRNANCFMPSDRVTVLASIREEWGSEEVFDAFVQVKLRRIVLRGKRRFFKRPIKVIHDVIAMLF